MKPFKFTDYLDSLIGRKVKVWQRTPTYHFCDGYDAGVFLGYALPNIYLRDEDGGLTRINIDHNIEVTSIKLVLEVMTEENAQ
jgi:hypothetical protein